MKICPQCQTEYDDSKRFCRKDGAKLIPSLPPEVIAKRAVFEEGISEQPDDPGRYLAYASYLEGLELFEAAVEQLEAGLKHGADPKNVRQRLVEVYGAKKDWDNAAVQLTLLLEQRPGDLQLRQELVKVYLRGGRQESAVKQVDALSARCSQDLEVLRWCRDKLAQLLQPGPLCEICRRIIKADPTDADTWALLARTLEKEGPPEEAAEAWEGLLKLRPMDASANLYAGIARSLAGLESGRAPWAEHAALFKQALAGGDLNTEESGCARLFQACALIQAAQETPEALKVLDVDAGAHGEAGAVAAAAAYRCLAGRCLEAGDAETALKYARRAHELADNEASRNALGHAHTAAGDAKAARRKWKEAARHYTEAKRACPSGAGLKEKQERAAKGIRRKRRGAIVLVACVLFGILAGFLVYHYGVESFAISTNEGANITVTRFGKSVFQGKGPEVKTGLLRLGPYQILVDKPGYTPREEGLLATFGRGSRTIEIQLEAQYGGLKLDSNPAGAAVLIDGEYRGATPLELKELLAKEHAILVKAPEQGVYADKLVIEQDRIKDLGVVQLKECGIKLESFPSGLAVLLQGEEVGRTPLVLRAIEPGEGTVSISDKGWFWKTSFTTPDTGLLDLGTAMCSFSADAMPEDWLLEGPPQAVCEDGFYDMTDSWSSTEDKFSNRYKRGATLVVESKIKHQFFDKRWFEDFWMGMRFRPGRAIANACYGVCFRKDDNDFAGWDGDDRYGSQSGGSQNYRFEISHGEQAWKLIKMYKEGNGTRTGVLQEGSLPVPLAHDEWVTLTVVCTGNRIDCRVNGQIAVQYYDYRNPIFYGVCGISVAEKTTIEVDRIWAIPLPLTPPLQSAVQWRRASESMDEMILLEPALNQADFRFSCNLHNDNIYGDPAVVLVEKTWEHYEGNEKREGISGLAFIIHPSGSWRISGSQGQLASVHQWKTFMEGYSSRANFSDLPVSVQVWNGKADFFIKGTRVAHTGIGGSKMAFQRIGLLAKRRRETPVTDLTLAHLDSMPASSSEPKRENVAQSMELTDYPPLQAAEFPEEKKQTSPDEADRRVPDDGSPSSQAAYGIHIASIEGVEHLEKARAYQAALKQNHGYDSEPFISKDGKYIGVLIVGFSDKQAAEAALSGVKQKTGVADAYVRALNPERSLAKTARAEGSEGDSGLVIADILNVRLLPELDAAVLGKLQEGEAVRILEEQGDWIKIETNKIAQGWVHRDYVISEKEVRAFVDAYLAALNRGDVEAIVALYADEVVYFGAGKVDTAFIRKDKTDYYKKWQQVHFTLQEMGTIKKADRKNTVAVDFHAGYRVVTAAGDKMRSGTAQNLLELEKAEGRLYIVLDNQKAADTKAQENARQFSGSPAQLTGTWRGAWEKSNGEQSDFTLQITHPGGAAFRAIGTVAGWTAWEVFEGSVAGNELTLKGVGVTKNQRPASDYELDELALTLAETAPLLTGKWSDASGSSGAVQVRFVSRDTDG